MNNLRYPPNQLSRKSYFTKIVSGLFVVFLLSCSVQAAPTLSPATPHAQITESHPTSTPPISLPNSPPNLTKDQITTLTSLKIIDDYPLYTMNYQGTLPGNDQRTQFEDSGRGNPAIVPTRADWSCSLFAAMGDNEFTQFGRNFDWEYSPGLLLFTNPPDGYASASMVDITYLGFEAQDLDRLHELDLAELTPLLNAPNWPFDGMNERGLAIGMAAVPGGQMRIDPQKPDIGSLEIMRQVLDHAANIHEAVSIIESYNIDFRGGPDLHYLIADISGEAVLVEFYEGKLHSIPSDNPWHLVTNFLVSAVNDPQGNCTRYDKISQTMQSTGGNLTTQAADNLLSSVSQNNTQWSVLYNMNNLEIQVTMGKQIDQPHKFQLVP